MSQMLQESVQEAIAVRVRKFMDLYKQGDSAGVAALYTEDAAIMPPNSDILYGQPAIQAVMQGMMDMGIKSLIFDIVEVDRCGDAAIEMSHYKLFGDDNQLLDQGKYIVVWKHVHGDWKLHRDIFNTSMPAA